MLTKASIIVTLLAASVFGVDVNLVRRASSTSATASPVPTGPYVQLHPNGSVGKCLDVKGNIKQNGTPVQIYDCNGSTAQNWIVKKGRTSVRLAGTNLCLDAGSTPGNNVPMKVWQCYDGLNAQDWWYTDDNRIALTDDGQCLDLTDGSMKNSNPVQTYKCTDYNTNQVWTVAKAGKSS